jgi:outer membrane protein OmpA-like peptidoglycan-associated protein
VGGELVRRVARLARVNVQRASATGVHCCLTIARRGQAYPAARRMGISPSPRVRGIPFPEGQRGAGLGADAQGAASRITGQVVSLGAAIRDLEGAATGVVVSETPKLPAPGSSAPPRREVKIYLPADVLFDFDKADLRSKAGPVLEPVATVLRSDSTASATIEGHTDGKGNDQYNQALSERRAQSVRLWLVAHGVASSMAARGFGKTRPVAPNMLPDGADNPEGRQKNRRVEITFTTTQ